MEEKDICIIGIGGGGCRMVDGLAQHLSDGPLLAAINTDVRALEQCLVPTRIQIGRDHTDGLGAGGHVSLGHLAAEEDVALVRELLTGKQLCIVLVGLGGGTGTGAAPVVLAAARALGAFTICFATLPFTFEGPQRRSQAEEAVPELRDACDILLLTPNDRLFPDGRKPVFTEAFRDSDQIVAGGVGALWQLLTHPGYLNLDFADLRALALRSGGICSFSYGHADGPQRGVDAATRTIRGALAEGGRRVEQARCVLVSIVGGPDLRLVEVGDVMQTVRAHAAPDAHIVMGTVVNDGWEGWVGVTLVLAEQRIEAPVPVPEVPEALRPRKAAVGKIEQPDLIQVVGTGRGRFKDVEPTIVEGEDLDIPAFVRRCLPIEK